MTIRCEIVSQDRSVFEGEADLVLAPTTEGQIGILPGHAPTLAVLGMGILTVRRGEAEEIFTVTGGFIEIQPDIVTVLADASEHIEEINVNRAQQARERAEKLLEEGAPPDTDSYLKIEAALRRSNLRLKAVEQYRKRGQRSRPPGMGKTE
jgi:F-type H+-transporting ATPase subunit epsilon